MALLFMDGFDHYFSPDLPKKWTGSSSATISLFSGRRGGGCLQTNATGDCFKAFPSPLSAVIVGAAAYLGALPGSSVRPLFQFRDGASIQITVGIDSSGNIKVFRGNVNGTLLATGASFTPTAWEYVEAKVVFHNTAGSVEVRLNGAPLINLTGVDTTSTANDYSTALHIGYLGTVGVSDHRYDDLYICDTTGEVNNDFLGDVRIDALRPAAGGLYQAFSPAPSQAVRDAAFLFWRLDFDINGGSSYYQIREVEMRATVGGADQCSGGTAIGNGSTPSAAFDNTTSTVYAYTQPLWVGYHFASPVSVKEVAITCSSDPTEAPVSLRLRASADGVDYTDIASFYAPVWSATETKTFVVPLASDHVAPVQLRFPGGASLMGLGVGDKESFTVEATTTLPSQNVVVAVQVCNHASKADAGAAVVRNLVRHGTSEAVGGDFHLSTTGRYVRSMHEINPSTGQPWLLTEAQAMQVGLEVVA